MHLVSHRFAADPEQAFHPESPLPGGPTPKPFFQFSQWGSSNISCSFETILFGLAILVYLLTHLVGLTRFPIYFFSDEAIQTVAAANLVRDDLRDEEGTLLPTYFKNGTYYNLSTSVYAQVLPYLMFGKSVVITRGTSVLISLLAALSISLILRDIYNIPYWWCGVLLLSIAPAWFLHSRTAFETVLFTSLYACLLYFYLLYRYRSPGYLYPAILLGALAFYSYSPGQIVIALTGILFLLSDGRYHWHNRRILFKGSLLAIILALPYLRFWISHPAASLDHLRTLDSYWLEPLPLGEKFFRFGSEYLFGLNPAYWFLPNERDLPRHLMKGYGHLFVVFLPFMALGMLLALRKIRLSAYRNLLIVLLVTPVGGALVAIGITRVLVVLIPAVLLITLGISLCLTWLEGKRLPRKSLAASLFAGLAITNIFILRDVLHNAPTWYQDYGLGGMQYGAQQLFPKIERYLEAAPQAEIILSPTWANGTDVIAHFYLGDPLPIQIGSVDGHISHLKPLDENTVFVMTPEEYQLAQESRKFKDIQVLETLPYPNGAPGFFFVRMSYVDQIEQIMEQERQERMQLRSAQIILNGQLVEAKHSLLDIGEFGHIFDGDPYTLGRTYEANPGIIELDFPSPRTIRGLSVIIGSTQVELRVLLYPEQNVEPVEFQETFEGSVDQPEVTFDFIRPTRAQKLRLEIRDLHQSQPGNVHIWEIDLY